MRSVVDQLKEMEEEKRTFEEDKRAKERVHVEKLVREMSLHTLYIYIIVYIRTYYIVFVHVHVALIVAPVTLCTVRI